jgi:hypothetical protein
MGISVLYWSLWPGSAPSGCFYLGIAGTQSVFAQVFFPSLLGILYDIIKFFTNNKISQKT